MQSIFGMQPETQDAAHACLTWPGYFGYMSVAFWAGLIVVGFGAVDLVMVAPFGAVHLAAVGQADILATAIMAGVLGFSDSFASRLARAEGARHLRAKLLPLGVALTIVATGLTVLSVFFAPLVTPLLTVFGQVEALIPLMATYITVRLFGAGVFLVFYASNETLKICGYRRLAIMVLVLGLMVNAATNGIFLYVEPLAGRFASPTAAVAWATLASEAVMAMAAIGLTIRMLRHRIDWFMAGRFGSLAAELGGLLRNGPGAGARRFNDYVSALIPLLLIGTLSVATVAAATVATRLYMIFCRIPQASFAASFVFYNYELGRLGVRSMDTARGLVRRLLAASGAITLAGLMLSALLLPSALDYMGSEVDQDLALWLLAAYFAALPAYVFEQFYAQLLVAHERGSFLFVSTTLTTYAVTLPLCWLVVINMADPFAVLLARGAGSIILAVVFRRAYSGLSFPLK